MADDEKERAKRAADLRKAIDDLVEGKESRPHPRSPRDFIEEKMREERALERGDEEAPPGEADEPPERE